MQPVGPLWFAFRSLFRFLFIFSSFAYVPQKVAVLRDNGHITGTHEIPAPECTRLPFLIREDNTIQSQKSYGVPEMHLCGSTEYSVILCKIHVLVSGGAIWPTFFGIL